MTPYRRSYRARTRCLAAAVVSLLLLGCVRDLSGPSVTITGPGGAELTAVRVEIADTPSKREVGLMYRKHLDEDAGMLFIFPESGHLSFWMKNTVIPLDMIFADSDARVVGIVADAEPFTETPRGVDGSAQYVLEVNAGFCARHHVAAGDRFEFAGFTPRTVQ